MAMTPEQMTVFFGDQARLAQGGLQIAVQTSNYFLAAQNIAQGFKCCLMRGLIQWRHGLAEPAAALADAVERAAQGPGILRSIRASDPCEPHLPLAQAFIVGYLVNRDMVTLDEEGLAAELQLDALLGRGLRGSWDQQQWDVALEKLRKNKRASLACETYALYAQLLGAPAGQTDPLVRHAEVLFSRRSKNGFYSGGEQTEGGGPDNSHTVDYRLAAVLKRIGYAGGSMHLWRWG